MKSFGTFRNLENTNLSDQEKQMVPDSCVLLNVTVKSAETNLSNPYNHTKIVLYLAAERSDISWPVSKMSNGKYNPERRYIEC